MLYVALYNWFTLSLTRFYSFFWATVLSSFTNFILCTLRDEGEIGVDVCRIKIIGKFPELFVAAFHQSNGVCYSNRLIRIPVPLFILVCLCCCACASALFIYHNTVTPDWNSGTGVLMAANSDSAPSSSSQSSSLKPEEDAQKHSQIPSFSSPLLPAEGTNIASPTMYPILVPCFAMQNQEHVGRGAGIYAVQTLPFADRSSGVPSCTLIPLTYSTPTSSAADTGVASGEQGQTAQQQQQQQLLQAQQLGGPQRQIVVRRFQIAFQLDLLLILKLAAVIFLFNQDGSRQRLALLVFLAALVYLYQTGALTPLIRWVSRAMHNAASPPRPARPAARAEPPQRPGNENAAAFHEGQQGENDQPAADEDVNRAPAEDEAVPEAAEANGADNNQWWGIVKEVQMIVFGFITSLLPGFHHHMD